MIARGPRRGAAMTGLVLLLVASACSGSGSSHPTSASTASTTSTRPSAPSTTAPPAATALTQQAEPALPVAVQESGGASAGGRLYVVGGYDVTRSSVADVWVFDGRSWRAGPTFPLRVNHPGVAAVGADVYVAGGFTPDGLATSRAFVLRGGAGQWSELPSMHRARGALSLVSVGGALLAIGGRSSTTQVAVGERFDPAQGAWTDLPAMPAPRNHLAGYVDGAAACVAGGRTPSTTAAVDCYDPATGWQSRPPLAVPTSGAGAATLSGVPVVAGGEPADETRLVGVVQWFHAGTWSQTPMLVPRHGAATAVLAGRVWACGGATAPGFHATADCTSIGLAG